MRLQFFVDPVQLGGQSTADICVLGVECLLKCFLGLPKSFSLTLVSLDVGGEAVELLLSGRMRTSTVDNLFLSDIRKL
jgi:hypothetical protein